MPRELENLEIEEISLVDEPAVPKAKFLIVKRDQEGVEDEMSEEKQISEQLKKQAIADEAKKVIQAAIGQIKEALRGQELPKKAKDLLEAAITSLEALASGYGYAYGYGYPSPAKSEEAEKRGRRFSKENEDRIREIYRLAKELIDQIEALDEEPETGSKAPWETERESEYLSKCVDVVNEIIRTLGGTN